LVSNGRLTKQKPHHYKHRPKQHRQLNALQKQLRKPSSLQI
jgi:hypothetical protein